MRALLYNVKTLIELLLITLLFLTFPFGFQLAYQFVPFSRNKYWFNQNYQYLFLLLLQEIYL